MTFLVVLTVVSEEVGLADLITGARARVRTCAWTHVRGHGAPMEGPPVEGSISASPTACPFARVWARRALKNDRLGELSKADPPIDMCVRRHARRKKIC